MNGCGLIGVVHRKMMQSKATRWARDAPPLPRVHTSSALLGETNQKATAKKQVFFLFGSSGVEAVSIRQIVAVGEFSGGRLSFPVLVLGLFGSTQRDERAPRMVPVTQRRPASLPLSTWLGVILLSGCGALQTTTAPETMVADPETRVKASSEGPVTSEVTDPMVVVELREGGEKPQYLRAPLKDSMLVQEALEGSAALDRFRRMDIVLVRSLGGREKLRLPVKFDSRTRRVAAQHNYALHGGDWLEVTEDTSTTFDRMIEQALQPLRPITRTRHR